MFNVRAAARFARLRFVPRQPKPPRKEHQQNSRSSLPFSFSPCSLIKSTKTVSEMLAQRAVVELCVDRLSTTRAAVSPPLAVFWDAPHVVKKYHHLDDPLAPLNVIVH